jgi:hypothetical protein
MTDKPWSTSPDCAARRQANVLRRIRRRTFCAACTIYAALVYVFVAATVFRVRHPWMTETELLAHTLDAMTWSTIEGRR